MKRGVIYARVSTEQQEKERTIESQIADLEAYCRANHILIAERYIDDGYSGALLPRPELDRLRDDAQQKRFETVVIHSVDRLSRNHIHAGIVKEELEKHGAEILFLNAPSTDTPEGQLLFDIQSVVAQYEKEKIKERTRRGRLFRARQGQIVGHMTPYGYRYVKTTDQRTYRIEEEEADVIRLIFDLYVKQDHSIRAISKALYARQIPAPKGGETWRTSTLKRLLSNESYIGVTHYNKYQACESRTSKHTGYKRIKNTGRRLRPRDEWIPIPVPAVLDPAIFHQAQEKRRKNRALSPRNSRYPYLFRGLVQHAPCGSAMYGTQAKDGAFYRCSNRERRYPLPKTCDGRAQAQRIDTVLWEVIQAIATTPVVVWNYFQEKEAASKDIIEAWQREQERNEQRLSALQRKEQKLVDAYAEGVFSAAEVKASLETLKQRRLILLQEKATKDQEYQQIMKRPIKKEDLVSAMQHLARMCRSTPFQKRRAIVERLIQNVVVSSPDEALVTLVLPRLDPMPPDERNIAFQASVEPEHNPDLDIMFHSSQGLEHKNQTVSLALKVDLKTKEYVFQAA